MNLVITIDTEEDNWGDFARPSFSVDNLGGLPRLQDLFMRHGVRPTYLITYPVATSVAGIEMLGSWREKGLCEIGTHPHPWNTPPFEEERTAINSYICNLPSLLQYKKIKTLTETIEANLGVRPTSYRSGRWGFNEEVARNLIRLRYVVDTSVFPTWDWSPGPDFTSYSHRPFTYRLDPDRSLHGSLLEVPPTVAFLQTRRPVATSLFHSIKRMPLGYKVVGGLNRLGVLNHVCISPEMNDATQMIRLTRSLLDQGTRVINMFFHSPSLLAGCSPFVRTPADLDAFMACIDQFLSFAGQQGLRSMTMSELTAHEVGASGVRTLPAPESAAV